MNIYNFSDRIKRSLIITRCTENNGTFMAIFEDSALYEPPNGFSFVCGYGDTPLEAINNYSNMIQSKRLILNVFVGIRNEHIVPSVLEQIKE